MSKDDENGEALARPQERAVRDVPAIVGRTLKHLRKTQGHSLERLAELSGVSRAMLGQIETGKSVPTVSLLWKVADALGVPLSSLIATQDAATAAVVIKDRTRLVASRAVSFSRRPLFPIDRFRGTEFYELRIGPRHREEAEAHAAGTRENLVVANGSLEVTIGQEAAIALAEGDAILFEAGVARCYENPGAVETLAYLVVMHCGRAP
jgi:transcriptional regulator with XRE-family HTH domain